MAQPAQSASDLTASNGRVTLAGSVWFPGAEPRAGILMVPGSGPSDRLNDVVFPPIRDHLVDRGVVVASFDKRGVGGSGGDWRTVGLDALAADALAELDVLRALDGVPADRVGLFGHSQGGWVVLEAAAMDGHAAFVVSHSGPGVGEAEQDRYAVRTAMARMGASVAELEAAVELYGEAMTAVRSRGAWDEFSERLDGQELAPQLALLGRAGFSWPTAEERAFLALVLDHDPAIAMRRIACPVLAMFGSDDALVPVARSIEVYEQELGQRGLLTTVVYPDADHRMNTGDPLQPVAGHPDRIAEWILDIQVSSLHPMA